MIEQVVGGRNIFQFNGPLQPPTWDGEDGLRAGQIAYDEDGIVVPGSPGPIWWDGIAWNRYSSSTDVPDLQAVTDEGATTDNDMTVSKVSGATSKVTVTSNAGAALAEISAGVEGPDAIASLLLQGNNIQISASTGQDIKIQNDSAQLLLTIFGSGIGIMFSNGIADLTGTGSPEGVITAPLGSTFRQSDGTAGAILWLKQSGAGNTGWAPLG